MAISESEKGLFTSGRMDMPSPLKVGVYVDGFNLYYGGRSICGKGKAGWKWLDLRKLSHRLLEQRSGWPAATELKVVYCTARVSGFEDPQLPIDQDAYIRALVSANSVDVIEFGFFNHSVSLAPLATFGKRGKPKVFNPQLPVLVQDSSSSDIHEAKFVVSFAKWEEKGTDVNLASYLLIDTFSNEIDAAIVISNDSDLKFPIQEVRKHIPVGTVNPSSKRTAGALRNSTFNQTENHWSYQLQQEDFFESQFPVNVGKFRKPQNW